MHGGDSCWGWQRGVAGGTAGGVGSRAELPSTPSLFAFGVQLGRHLSSRPTAQGDQAEQAEKLTAHRRPLQPSKQLGRLLLQLYVAKRHAAIDWLLAGSTQA